MNSILVDTNILLRYADQSDLNNSTVIAALSALHAFGRVPCIVPRNIYEFWVVATRPKANNGLGLLVADCARAVADIEAVFTTLPDPPGLFELWRSLVEAHDCKGKVAHDTRIVAAMRGHGLADLLTLNAADFRRFPGLTPLGPASAAP